MNFSSHCDSILVESNMESIHFDNNDTKSFVEWINKTNPTLVREIVCSNCEVHVENLNYGDNKVERGK